MHSHLVTAHQIVGSFGPKIIDFANGDRKTGFVCFPIIVNMIFIVCSAIIVINCKDEVTTRSTEKTAAQGMFYDLLANGLVKIILSIALFFNFAYQLFSLYDFSCAIGNENLYPVYIGIAQMAALFTFPMRR